MSDRCVREKPKRAWWTGMEGSVLILLPIFFISATDLWWWPLVHAVSMENGQISFQIAWWSRVGWRVGGVSNMTFIKQRGVVHRKAHYGLSWPWLLTGIIGKGTSNTDVQNKHHHSLSLVTNSQAFASALWATQKSATRSLDTQTNHKVWCDVSGSRTKNSYGNATKLIPKQYRKRKWTIFVQNKTSWHIFGITTIQYSPNHWGLFCAVLVKPLAALHPCLNVFCCGYFVVVGGVSAANLHSLGLASAST